MCSGGGFCPKNSPVVKLLKMQRLNCSALRGEAMKYSWFHHHDCTTQQADELMDKYRKRGVKVERSLNQDFTTWTVSVELVEDRNPPRPDSRWRNRMWG